MHLFQYISTILYFLAYFLASKFCCCCCSCFKRLIIRFHPQYLFSLDIFYKHVRKSMKYQLNCKVFWRKKYWIFLSNRDMLLKHAKKFWLQHSGGYFWMTWKHWRKWIENARIDFWLMYLYFLNMAFTAL